MRRILSGPSGSVGPLDDQGSLQSAGGRRLGSVLVELAFERLDIGEETVLALQRSQAELRRQQTRGIGLAVDPGEQVRLIQDLYADPERQQCEDQAGFQPEPRRRDLSQM